ncbi:unnamed protein product [Haemonchus placei]|uniref:DUF3577 domain-containing protein n=1 Tax=Haemonchus placei TaxID=6290 RepID=A0A0N4WTQ1_HAEPC|nr:unnamed protein product [Haemonchus placei]
MAPIHSIIGRASNATNDPTTQMQIIRRIIEDIYGGSWGVLIIRSPDLVSDEVHWTIPDHTNADGSPAFCLAVVKGWQYNVFKTGSKDAPDRVTVEGIVKRWAFVLYTCTLKEAPSTTKQSDEKQRPQRMSVQEFDRRLAAALQFGN